jgi:hypothetical protein
MYTLGINAAFHDPAACLVKDGRVLAAAEEERFTHVKHGKRPVPFSTWELPFHAVDYCLKEAGINLTDVDHVAYSFDPSLLLGRWNSEATIALPLEPSAHPTPAEWLNVWDPLFLASIVNAPRHLASGAPHHLKERFRGARPDGPYRWHFVNHHIAHAASEATREQLEAWAARSPVAVRYLPVRQAHGPAAARNVGWQSARGAVIAFTDDDCAPAPGWLRAGVAAVEAGADAATGRVEMPLPERPTDYERNEARLAVAEFVTANCFCRRDVLEVVGGFDERFTMAWREDSDLHFTLLEHGRRIVRAPDALVVHPLRPAPWGVSLAQQGKARFNALLYKKHPDLYRRRIQPAPPWHYYAIGASLLAALVGVLAGRPWLAACGGGAWAALTAWFCPRRLYQASADPRHVAEMVVTSALIPLLSIYWRLRGAVQFGVFFL